MFSVLWYLRFIAGSLKFYGLRFCLCSTVLRMSMCLRFISPYFSWLYFFWFLGKIDIGKPICIDLQFGSVVHAK